MRSKFLIALIILALPVSPVFAAGEEDPSDATPTPEAATGGKQERLFMKINGANASERASALLNFCAMAKPGNPLFPKEAMIYYVARIVTGKDVPYAIARWREALAKTLKHGQEGAAEGPGTKKRMEPFDKHTLVWAWILCHDKTVLPPEFEQQTKAYVSLWHHKVWKGYGALNYRLMMDGTGYLAAQQWPDLKDADGLDAEQIKAATKGRLMGYFSEIVRRNTHEYGSPTYLGVDLSVMKMLADHVKDPELRNAAMLTLDAMFLQMAAAWNDGYLITPAGRAKHWSPSITSPDAMDATATCGWVFWGGARPVSGGHLCEHHSGWFGLPGYRTPALVDKVATDRSKPMTNLASFCHGYPPKGELEERFTIHQEKGYGVASQWEYSHPFRGDVCKEMRRVMLKWVSDKPLSSFMPLQQNLASPHKKGDVKANAFGYGENPYSQVIQSEGTLASVCKVAETYPHWKTYAPFSNTGSIVKRTEKEGWVFCHGGSVLFAFRTVRPWKWVTPAHDCDVLESNDRTNGWVLETSPVTPYAGGGIDAELERFAAAVCAKVTVDESGMSGDLPRLKVKNLSGHELDITFRPIDQPYTDQHKIDGRPLDYKTWPLIGTPWCRQAVDADTLEITADGKTLRYDFKTWTRTGG